jgi:hypothetical protein
MFAVLAIEQITDRQFASHIPVVHEDAEDFDFSISECQ